MYIYIACTLTTVTAVINILLLKQYYRIIVYSLEILQVE